MRTKLESDVDSRRPALIVTYGTTTRKIRQLEREIMVLGRAPGCDIGLASPEVAPVHCVVARTKNGWRVRDCSGRAGIRVNGKPVTEGELKHGDTLQVGTFSFEAHLPDSNSQRFAMNSRDDYERLRRELEEEGDSLDHEREELDDLATKLKEREEELDDVARETELQMSRERAQIARDRVELQRMRDDLRVEQGRLRREGGGLLGINAPIRKPRADALDGSRPGTEKWRELMGQEEK